MKSSSVSKRGVSGSQSKQPGKCPFKRPGDTSHATSLRTTSATNDTTGFADEPFSLQGQITTSPEGSSSYHTGDIGSRGTGNLSGHGMGGYGMGGYGMGMGMGGYGMGMGGYGMGMGGYGMGGMGMGMDSVMGPLMSQLMMVQSLNYTLMSFGQIVQSLGINAGSILQFGNSILRTLDALAIAIKKSQILSPSKPPGSGEDQLSSSGKQQQQQQQLKRRRRAVLVRWALVVLTMAITSQVLRIVKCFSDSSLPAALAQQVFQFFRSFVAPAPAGIAVPSRRTV